MVHGETGTISDVRMRQDDFLVINFSAQTSSQRMTGDTVRTKESRYYFFQIVDVSELTYKPFTPKDTNGNEVGPIEPEDGVGYTQLFDENGDDILRNTDSPWRIYHYSIGVRQPDVRVYPRVPESINGGGFEWLSASQPVPEEGTSLGYVAGSETDFDDPSAKLSQVAYKEDSLTDIQYGIYNDNDTIAINPVMSVVGYGYELRPVHKEENMIEILAQLGKRPADKDVAVHVINYSPHSLRTYSYNVPSEWDGAENNLNVSDTNLPRTLEESIGINNHGNGGDTVGEEEVEEPDIERVNE